MNRATGRLISLVLVTLCALAVMITFGAGRWFGEQPSGPREEVVREASPASVIVKTVRREPIEIIDRYSGTIEPLERFSLGFQIAGRLELLGESELGHPLDEGDQIICRRPLSPAPADEAAADDRRAQILKKLTPALVPEGFLVSRLLARLDSELLRVQREELMVQLEQAHYDREKAYTLLQRDVITDAEYRSRRTDFAAASFRYRAADRRLRDSQLRLVVPAHGALDRPSDNAAENSAAENSAVENGAARNERRFVISKRQALPGETLSAHQTVFEVVEVDRVKLVIGVPVTRVRELDLRMREVEANRRRVRAGEIVAPEDLQIPVHVRLLGKRRFGKEWPKLSGYVFQVSETAADNFLFDVEIILDNPDGTLKPGLFAMAEIVLERIDGFRLPRSAIRYGEGGAAYVFSVDAPKNSDESDSPPAKATRYYLQGPVAQGNDVIVRDLPAEHRTLVVRGQHRLTPGRPVKIVGGDIAAGANQPQPK